MLTFIVIAVVSILGLSLAGGLWFYMRQRAAARPDNAAKPANPYGFRWQYIIGPLIVTGVSTILAAAYYTALPDPSAMHFLTDGAPDKWTNPPLVLVWYLLPQFGLVILAAIVSGSAGFIIKANIQDSSLPIPPHKIITIMGNMIAVPQLILAFAMLDVFTYNVNGIHLLPVWVFALIVIFIGTVLLGRFFMWALRSSQKTS